MKITEEKNVAYEAPDFINRTDRVGQYFEPYTKDFVFDEFSDAHLKRENLADIMQGVPIPMRHQDVVDFHTKKGLQLLNIAQNMTWIIGINPQFQYTPCYCAYLNHYFDAEKLSDAMVREGNQLVQNQEVEEGVIHFRAALVIDPDNLHAMYSYARGCRELYLAAEGQDKTDYVGRFKAEAMEYFELTTLVHPDFDQAYYYLGYAYLNMGLYTKAALVWKTFLSLTEDEESRKDVEQRIRQLQDPTEIEQGCNCVMSSRFRDGIGILERFTDSQYKDWWPLHYYLGVAYRNVGEPEKAMESFEAALKLNPSHIDTMKEMAGLYKIRGNDAMSEKYRNKIQVILKNE